MQQLAAERICATPMQTNGMPSLPIAGSGDGDVNAIPCIANKQPSAFPGLFNVVDVAASKVPAPQAPKTRPYYLSTSPMF
eukprot:2497407-Amphidinium_carterae.2